MLSVPVSHSSTDEIVREIHDVQVQLDAMNARLSIATDQTERDDLAEGLRIGSRWLTTLEGRLQGPGLEVR
jgi:hypothetical protein